MSWTTGELPAVIFFTLTSGERIEHVTSLDGVTLVEEYDRYGRIVDRWRPENAGAAPLRRKGDTNTAWRS